ncbi:MAG: hypothetical protein M1831_004279 [Alyxoria varia]|nr:MAG: hypothetical protein M1831_004279 [Alyxoria varia]
MPGRLLGIGRTDSTSSRDHRSHDTSAQNIRRTDSSSTNHQGTMEHLKRTSLGGLAGLTGKHHHHHHHHHHHKEKKGSNSPSLKPTKPTDTLDLIVESPPAIFYGAASNSTGALYSGRLKLNVITASEIILDKFNMKLIAVTTMKKPVAKDCGDCSQKSTKLHDWNFLSGPKTLSAGEHHFPFSHLIPGHLPTTTHGHLGVIEYFLDAKATTKQGEELSLRTQLILSRAIPPGEERYCTRIFPPTNVAAHLSFSPTIHPIGRYTALLRVTGILENPPEKKDIQNRWRLRKFCWKLEETEHMVSPACDRHSGKVGGAGRGLAHEETRILAREDLKEGWKTDFDAGEIDLEFHPATTAASSSRALCDVDAPNGLKISHALVLELVIAEEWLRHGKRNDEVATPTGGARVLRASFPVHVTERAGLGISWDEETPPVYEDVPESPPLYSQDTTNRGTSLSAAEASSSERTSFRRGYPSQGSLRSRVAGHSTPNQISGHGEVADYEGPPLADEEVDGLSMDGLRMRPPTRHDHNSVGGSSTSSGDGVGGS